MIVRTVDRPNGNLFQQWFLAQRLILHRLPTDDRRRGGEKVRTPLQNPPHAVAAGAQARDGDPVRIDRKLFHHRLDHGKREGERSIAAGDRIIDEVTLDAAVGGPSSSKSRASSQADVRMGALRHKQEEIPLLRADQVRNDMHGDGKVG